MSRNWRNHLFNCLLWGPLIVIYFRPVIYATITTALVFGISKAFERLFGDRPMPRATVSQNTERFDLKTCPEGYVVVRRMTYGEKLNRQEDMMNMQTSTEDKQMQIKLMTRKVAFQDFANLIIEHNLTDDDDKPLNFKNAADVARLDPRIGDEVGQYIDMINSFEGDEATKNF